PVSRLVARARLAEANGNTAVWVPDERFHREVYSCLGQIATQTSKVLVGPSVTDPYARHPALTAMAIATLDEISDGRAILGIGAGISGFAEMQIDRRKPALAMREAIEVIRMLLRGETVDYQGEVISLNQGRLAFRGPRASIPVYVAANGLLGQQMAAGTADGLIVQACASVEEVRALRVAIADGAQRVARDANEVKLIAALRVCIADDGRAARDAVRPTVARYLGAASNRNTRHAYFMNLRTAEAQGLALPPEAIAQVAGRGYSAGTAPYLSLLPLITDRHVDALALAGTVDEVAAHAARLFDAGIDGILARPMAEDQKVIDETIIKMGAEVLPRIRAVIISR
ncbi:MAG TPA: LLM class flavin-dependent oxidoreductase, partial [Ktedonobacterales bacterium]|nr:LLM class flavin-dependent oxidoreductase [Ktedonobacterales bacterium]